MKKHLLALSIAILPLAIHAEELNDIFKRVNDLVAQRNYSKALDELSWAKKEIEKLNTGQVASFFPDTLGGLKGDKFESSSALGFHSAERTYRGGDSVTIKVSLTGASGGGNEGMGALMGIGKMAAMMDIPGQEAVRIQGRTATMNTENEGSPKLTIFLDSGSMLMIESESGGTATQLRKMADELKLEDLDKYLKG
jgi:hypothetical protein